MLGNLQVSLRPISLHPHNLMHSTVNNQLAFKRFAHWQKVMMSTLRTWAHSSSKAKLKQTIAAPIFTAFACHASLLSAQSEGSHILNRTSRVTSHSLFWSGVTWDQHAVNTTAPCFKRGVLCEDWRPWLFRNFSTPLVEKTWFSHELSPLNIQVDNTGRCVVSVERLSQKMWLRWKTTKHKPQTFVCECHYVCAFVWTDQNAKSVSLSRTSSAIYCAKSLPVWLTECSKDPLLALLKSSGSHLNQAVSDSLGFHLAKHWLQQLAASSLIWTGASNSEEAAELKQTPLYSNPNCPKRCPNPTFT